jgi:hypothetical protein
VAIVSTAVAYAIWLVSRVISVDTENTEELRATVVEIVNKRPVHRTIESEARLRNARSLLGEVLIRQFGPAFGGVYQLGDSRSERITNAVMDRLFLRR